MQDEDSEIYLESLNLLKYIVGSLSPHLSKLDLHLMLGSFIGLIVQKSQNTNMRVQVQTDKVIIYFAKHQNIGSFVIAREISKSLDKLNGQFKNIQNMQKPEQLQDQNQALLRFYGILLLLLQQFSIVLCYQQDFYTKCLECLADTMNVVCSNTGLYTQPDQLGNAAAIKNTRIRKQHAMLISAFF